MDAREQLKLMLVVSLSPHRSSLPQVSCFGVVVVETFEILGDASASAVGVPDDEGLPRRCVLESFLLRLVFVVWWLQGLSSVF